MLPVRVALLPSTSVAVTRTRMMPGWAGTTLNCPAPVKTALVQVVPPSVLVATLMLPMLANAEARAVTSTVAPGCTAIDGVVVIDTTGAFDAASAATRRVKVCVLVVPKPSVTLAVTW